MASLPDVDRMDGTQHAVFSGKMRADAGFQNKLENDEIIAPGHEQYEKWRQMRTHYNRMLSEVVIWRLGFRPAQHRPVTFFTYMFLHGGIGHLLGNMIVLWLVGCIVEIGCGRPWYPAIYIPGGLAAVGLFWLVYTNSMIPLVGASGAIAALMGAFAVLYGTKKIKIFYTLGFYFGYRQVYGFALLPVWIGNELYQLFGGGASNVAYVAHLGGLLGGAMLGLVCRKTHGTQAAEEIFRQEPVDKISPIIEKAMECMGRLDMNGARVLLEQALELEPGNETALRQLFSIARHQPESMQFHTTAEQVLMHLCRSRATYGKACELYADYCSAAAKQRLSPGLYLLLGTALAETGRPEQAERLLAALLRQKTDLDGLPAALLKLADSFRKKNLPAKAAACLQSICTTYPASPAARIAATALAAQAAQLKK